MGRWKDGAQCAVMLTFDVDAETLWLAGDLTNLDKPGAALARDHTAPASASSSSSLTRLPHRP